MSRITKPLFIAAMLVMPLAAQANVESWAFSTTSGSGTRCLDADTSCGAANNNNNITSTPYGNTFEFRTSTGNTYENNVTVAGFSTTNDSVSPVNGFETAQLRMWNGLGMVSREDTDTAPHHSMDNDGGTAGNNDEITDSGDVDAAYFSFNEAINLTSINIGWTNPSVDEITSARIHDADISVLAYTGTGTPPPPTIAVNATNDSTSNTQTFQTLLNQGWTFVGHYADLHYQGEVLAGGAISNGLTSISTGGISSSYWLISAYTSHADGDGNSNASNAPTGLDFGNDYFKIAGLGGQTVTPPSTQVPEPTSLVLLALGLIGWRMTRNALGLADPALSTSSMAA